MDSEMKQIRERVAYSLENQRNQNFGDFLTVYLLDRLFLHVPRLPGEVRLIGSCLDDDLVASAIELQGVSKVPEGAALTAWGVGMRDAGGLSLESLAHTEILSVRGPRSASDLGLGDLFPQGDPALLLPSLYKPTKIARLSGQTICVPHFNDTRSDEEVKLASGANYVLRPSIRTSLDDVENFLDALTSADFVLCGSLPAAIAAVAYGIPFAFWDNGAIDTPFEWEDFAGSVNIPCQFVGEVAAGQSLYAETLKGALKIPALWDSLSSAPFPIRSDALLRILKHEMSHLNPQESPCLDDAIRMFEKNRQFEDAIVANLDMLVGRLSSRVLNTAAFSAALPVAQSSDQAPEPNPTSADLIEALESSQEKARYFESESRLQSERAAILNAEAEYLVKRLYRAYRNPWLPLKTSLQRSGLNFALIFKPFLSKRRVTKFKKSLAKRKPRQIQLEWRALQEKLQNMAPGQTQSGPFAIRSEFSDPAREGRILVLDYRIPRPDVSAGERATMGILSDLVALGFEVSFASTDMAATSPYFEMLKELGVDVITEKSGFRYASDYVRAKGHEFSAFYMIRVDVAEHVIKEARSASPRATLIFHAPDLYFLREMRAAELKSDPKAIAAARATRERELAIMHAADHVVLVSDAEVPYLSKDVSPEKISVFPALYSTVVDNPASFQSRQHMFFLGGFKHAPNVDSVKWFAKNVWPKIHSALPQIEFHIIGAEAPQDVIDLGKLPGIRFIGYVPDIDPIMSSYRIAVAPLTYGAGIKGKVGASMGAGLPTICTTIAAEGMGIKDGVHTLVRDDPETFAEATILLYGDEILWNRFSVNGRQLVEANFGEAANRSSFMRMLNRAHAMPEQIFIDYCKKLPAQAFPQYESGREIDVSIIVPVFNKWELTRDCLVSIAATAVGNGVTYEVILADDGSTDETVSAAEVFPGLKIAKTPTNLGFLRNCKNAASMATGRHLLFLNNDTIVMPGWLKGLYDTMEAQADAAIVGSKLVYPDGTIQEAGGVLFSDGSGCSLGKGKPRFDPLHNMAREVDYISGASILVRGSFWNEVGGFDERYGIAYCEDSDLAMTARDRGMRVLYEPSSEVIHFEHGSYGDQINTKPKALMRENGKILLAKWAKEFKGDYLPVGTDPGMAAAHAERKPSEAAIERRKTGSLNILYFSPFPSHPDNHGNQATIQSFGRRFKALGHKVHFALLQSKMYNDDSVAMMQEAWDSFTILPNTHPLGSNGKPIPFDDWYPVGLGEQIRTLCSKYDIDVVFCSYVFQSKLLEYVPAHMLKVIDTHDKMGNRYDMLRKNGQPLEFFSCSPEEEGEYLRRADVVVARRQEEADYFDSVSGKKSAIVIPHFEERHFTDRHFNKLKDIGLVASANRVNLAMLSQFLETLEKKFGTKSLPFKVHIAGQVKNMVHDLPKAEAARFSRPWVKMHGFVPDIANFYQSVDVVISPITMGTGINVKTVQAMAYGMPLVTTEWGSKGIETGAPMHTYADLDGLCEGLFNLVQDPSGLDALAALSRSRYEVFYQDGIDAMIGLTKEIVS